MLGGNQVSSIFDNNLVTGQSQSGLWLGKTDDLWSWGKPQGWGAVWRYTPITLPAKGMLASDPYLMTGFDKKALHMRCDSATCGQPGDCSSISMVLEVDFTGSAGHLGPGGMIEPWSAVQSFDWSCGGGSPYAYYIFPDGFSAHWARLRAVNNYGGVSQVNVTAHFTYT